MKSRLCIRTDGNSGIGLGHLMRCIALAQMVKAKFSVSFFCLDIPISIASKIISEGFEFIKIESNDEFIKLIKNDDLIILDGYQFTEKFQIEIKKTDATLICIDDLHNKHYYADLIINHAPGITTQDYSTELYTQFALGPEYVLLRPGFLKASSEKAVNHDNEILFICFGGADPRNMTEQILNIVSGHDYFKEINVVTGSAFINSENIETLSKKDDRIRYFQSIDDVKMLELMQRSGIAIVPAGGILLECLAAGCNVISGLYVDNQKFIYSNYLQANTFTDAGDFSKEKIIHAIEKAISNVSLKRKVFDGNSGKRIEKLLLNLKKGKALFVRKAIIDDIEITYKWASDPVIRKHSFNKNEIKKEEHIHWFQNKISVDNCIYLIAEKENITVGSIRFDIENDDALISYLIDPIFHGNGYGQSILCKGLIYLMEISKSFRIPIRSITGNVFIENISSMKAFERTGFLKMSETKEYITFSKKIAV